MSHHHHDHDHHHDDDHHHHHHHFRFLPRDPRLRLVVLILLAISVIYGTVRYVVPRLSPPRPKNKKIEQVALEPENMEVDGSSEDLSLEDNSEDTTPTQLGILERPLDVFNFSNLNMAGLSTILNEEGLELNYPPATKSLALTVQEAGGRPLGEILAQMLASHGYTFIRQDNRVQIQEAAPYVAARKDQEEDKLQPCLLKTTLDVKPESPCELWIDSSPPIHLKLRIDPLYGEATEDSGNTTRQVCTIVARRGYRRVFRQILSTKIDRTASIQIQMAQDALEAETDEILSLSLKPLKCNKEGVTVELSFENKASE